ncbi:MAG: DUF3307 domain-containing protein [Cytophagales bacterium]
MNLSLIFLAHWMGDFLFQTTKMATSKAHSLKWLSLHALVYGSIMTVFATVIIDIEKGLIFGLVNMLLHFITDFFTSKVMVKYLKRPRIFFPLLGIDQMIHMITLHLTLENISKIQDLIV